MGRVRYTTRALAAALIAAVVAVVVAVPGLAQPAPTLSVSPATGASGDTTMVDGTGFRGVGDVSITEGGIPAGTTTAEPSGKLVAVPIIITGVGAVLVRGCQDDGAGDPCGFTATATFTATAPPTTSTTTTTTTTTSTTTTVPTTTTTRPPTTTTTTTPSTTTTSLPGTTTTSTVPGSTTTSTVSTTTTEAGTSTTTAPSSATTAAPTTSTTGEPPALDAPEGSGPGQSADPEDSGDQAITDEGDGGDANEVAAARIARNTDEVAVWPFVVGGLAVWAVAIGAWLLARRRSVVGQDADLNL